MPRMLPVRALSRMLRTGLVRRYAAEAKSAAQQKQAPAASTDDLRLTFASPTSVLFNNAVVKQVDVYTLSGSIGILPKHVPVLGMLKPGIVRIIDNEGKSTKYFASSGTVAMNPDGSCQVLAEEVANLEDIDVAVAEHELKEAERRIQEATDETSKMAIQIEMTTFEALIKAAQEAEK